MPTDLLHLCHGRDLQKALHEVRFSQQRPPNRLGFYFEHEAAKVFHTALNLNEFKEIRLIGRLILNVPIIAAHSRQCDGLTMDLIARPDDPGGS